MYDPINYDAIDVTREADKAVRQSSASSGVPLEVMRKINRSDIHTAYLRAVKYDRMPKDMFQHWLKGWTGKSAFAKRNPLFLPKIFDSYIVKTSDGKLTVDRIQTLGGAEKKAKELLKKYPCVGVSILSKKHGTVIKEYKAAMGKAPKVATDNTREYAKEAKGDEKFVLYVDGSEFATYDTKREAEKAGRDEGGRWRVKKIMENPKAPTSQIGKISKFLEGSFVMQESPTTAYWAASAVRDAMRARDFHTRLQRVKTALKNWRVTVNPVDEQVRLYRADTQQEMLLGNAGRSVSNPSTTCNPRQFTAYISDNDLSIARAAASRYKSFVRELKPVDVPGTNGAAHDVPFVFRKKADADNFGMGVGNTAHHRRIQAIHGRSNPAGAYYVVYWKSASTGRSGWERVPASSPREAKASISHYAPVRDAVATDAERSPFKGRQSNEYNVTANPSNKHLSAWDAKTLLESLTNQSGPPWPDFHSLDSEAVSDLINAPELKFYKAPRGASGSRGRYLYAYLEKLAASYGKSRNGNARTTAPRTLEEAEWYEKHYPMQDWQRTASRLSDLHGKFGIQTRGAAGSTTGSAKVLEGVTNVADAFAEAQEIANKTKKIYYVYKFHPEFGWLAARSGSGTGKEKWDATSVFPQRAGRRNPTTSSDMYETFHGKPSTKETIYESEEFEREHFAELGDLIQLKVATATKKDAVIDAPNPDVSDIDTVVKLACSPDGKQLFFIGGDQELDLKSLGFTNAMIKDHMLVGVLYELTYRTAKGFHKFKVTDYFHELGEETGDQPVLLYNPQNKSLSVAGGAYEVKDVGICN